MNVSSAVATSNLPVALKKPFATYAGLAIALLGAPIFAAVYRALTGERHSDLQLFGREFGFFLLAVALLWIIRTQEELAFRSIGLQTDRLARSFGRGLLVAIVLIAVSVALYVLLPKVGLHIGDNSKYAFKASLWIAALVTVRAGVIEEFFYRGFAIERLKNLGGSTTLAWVIPLIAFAGAHYRQGLGGIITAAVLGGILTLYYLKRRDLLANMTAHFLVDFVFNVGMPLLSRG
jgi:uncharacterized protein